MQQIASLKNIKSCEYDNISSFFVTVSAEILANPLSYLFNLAFQFGMFPLCLKTAKAIPIFKNGDKSDISNYRPISILSTSSKILEKLICVRARQFLQKHSILSPTQYGFRPMLSTSDATPDLLTSTYDNINNHQYTALLFLDLKKAFYTVNHEILINKMDDYGIREQLKLSLLLF